jgi:hypothetical protein
MSLELLLPGSFVNVRGNVRILQPVIWSKGVFVSPQHLQAQDRFIESLVQFRSEALTFRPWGFTRLQINQEALVGGLFSIHQASGLFPDGLAFDIPDSDAAPPVKSVAEFFGPKRLAVSRSWFRITTVLTSPRSPVWAACIDRDGVVHGMVQRIMEDPIKQGEGLLRGVGSAQLNGSGRRFCSAFAELTDKYPFKTESKTDATLDDLNTVFRPVEGKFDQFYESALKNYHVHRSRGRHQGLHLARSIASGKACRQLGRLRFRIHQL